METVNTVPMAGDVVVIRNQSGKGELDDGIRGVLEGKVGEPAAEYDVLFRPMHAWKGDYVSGSGGPVYSRIPISMLQPAGKLDQLYAKWGPEGPKANGAVYWTETVNAWTLDYDEAKAYWWNRWGSKRDTAPVRTARRKK